MSTRAKFPWAVRRNPAPLRAWFTAPGDADWSQVLREDAAIKGVDVQVPTTDGRLLILPQYTQPEKDHQMLLHELMAG